MFRVAIMRSLVVTLIAGLSLLFLQPGGAGAAAALTLNPTSGPTGTIVSVTGNGFSAGTSLPVTIFFNGTSVATTTSSNTGTISTTFAAPAVTPGTYTVTAASTYAATSAQFTVTSSPASISLSPTSGPAGTVVTVSGSGFGANQTASLSFNGVTGGSFTTSGTGAIPAGISFIVPNVANGVYTVRVSTAGQSGTAQFTVGASTGAFVAAKFVTVNGLGYSTAGSARPGDTLTYQLRFTNNTANSLNVTATDVIAPGQTVLAPPGFPCSFTGTNTLTCAVGTIASGGSAALFISTVVNAGFTGTITNQASATTTITGTTTAGPPATTNSTVVTVGTVVPVTATFELCGPVTSYTSATSTANGSITISGVTVIIAAGAVATNVVTGSNECILANVNGSRQLTAVAGATNLSGVSVACGVYTTAASGFVNAGGIPIAVAPGTTFVGGLVAGGSYCFILNASGQAIGAVAGIPTRAIFPTRHHPYWFERVRTVDI